MKKAGLERMMCTIVEELCYFVQSQTILCKFGLKNAIYDIWSSTVDYTSKIHLTNKFRLHLYLIIITYYKNKKTKI